MTNTFKHQILKIFKQYRFDFIFIVTLMVVVGFAQASSILGLMPLVDFMINNDLENANKVTKFVVSLISRVNLPVNIITMGGFFLLLIIAKNGMVILRGYFTNKVHFKIMKKIIFDPFHKESNQKKVTFDNISYRELYVNKGEKIKPTSKPKKKRSLGAMINNLRAEVILRKNILGNPLVDRIPRFILFPIIKYWLYYDFLFFRYLIICYKYFKGTLESVPYPIYDKLTQKVKRLDDERIKDQRAFRDVKSLRKIMALDKNKITDKISITEQSQQSLWKGV